MIRIQRDVTFAMIAALLVPALVRAQTACRAGELEVRSLGIGGLSCDNCTLFQPSDPRESRWEFGSEPTVMSIEDDSPAADVLRRGDVIIAVDGHLITTQEGGRRFRRPDRGAAISMRVRRAGREMTVSVQPTTVCETTRDLSTTVGVGDGRVRIDSVHVTRGRASLYPTAGRTIMPTLLPDGWMGMSFVCSRCQVQLLEDSTRVWSFIEPPSVISVERDGPAARSGLRNGDRLLSIDGVDLLSSEGGERFGAVAPGQTVVLEVGRGSTTRTIRLQAIARSTGIGSGSRGTGVSVGTSSRAGTSEFSANVVRYSGRIGDTMIEVTGDPVTVTQTDGETIIRSSTITVRLRREGR